MVVEMVTLGSWKSNHPYPRRKPRREWPVLDLRPSAFVALGIDAIAYGLLAAAWYRGPESNSWYREGRHVLEEITAAIQQANGWPRGIEWLVPAFLALDAANLALTDRWRRTLVWKLLWGAGVFAHSLLGGYIALFVSLKEVGRQPAAILFPFVCVAGSVWALLARRIDRTRAAAAALRLKTECF